MKNRISVSGRNVAVHSFFVFAALLLMGGCRMPFDWSLDVPGDWGMDSGSGIGGDAGTGTLADGPAPVPEPAPEPVTSTASEIVVTGDHFTLYWDESLEDVLEYRLFVRERGGETWQPLGSGLSDPSARITTGELVHGSYEFAVSYVNLLGVESELHSSLDATADPDTGWYLTWNHS